MFTDEKFEELHNQFKPMINRIIKRLAIYKNEQEFYQIGCIALWEASLQFNEEKGEFKSYAYSYIMGKMKTMLTNESIQQEKDRRLEANPIQEQTSGDDSTSSLLSHSVIDSISSLLTKNQNKWLKAHCLYGKTPSEIAKDEGVSSSAVKAWRRDAIARLKKHLLKEALIER
ncbi:sigma-70 family RNA polymerase sigma factor [Metabacillus rhizolycopersici]|uniref:Sigma-70 family RNA polymerase sigma factor n=1 Tax=Metabacillus rhizolycopersici TaxID=2875709 RepID=A0ABS7UZK9_9BACI|nr:sigma-70 family RNA polymerase sigma factor [Metabacillus rhizolycopersici]MBZ5753566.1 sigma-70 family RNA polymerase sigma factor [Metabacillus rhizolycopersici]